MHKTLQHFQGASAPLPMPAGAHSSHLGDQVRLSGLNVCAHFLPFFLGVGGGYAPACPCLYVCFLSVSLLLVFVVPYFRIFHVNGVEGFKSAGGAETGPAM